jgi:hypothetical protein
MVFVIITILNMLCMLQSMLGDTYPCLKCISSHYGWIMLDIDHPE